MTCSMIKVIFFLLLFLLLLWAVAGTTPDVRFRQNPVNLGSHIGAH